MITKYQREEIARYDKEQTVFQDSSLKILSNPNHYAKIQLQFNPTRILVCPFCLTPNALRKYLIKPSNKFMACCPNCKQNVLFKTLFEMLKWTGIEFADFVSPYAKTGFWSKVFPNFEEWNKKLHELNMSYDFWFRYKSLKGDYEENEQNEKNDL
jgi:hypothetical protein